MPQEFQVLRCYSCETFQVHIMKKSNKWCCKMCGEKQSLKKVYGQGSGKDCRKHVQSLNEKRMINDLNISGNIQNEPDNNDIEETESCHSAAPAIVTNSSKWSDYLTEENQLSEPESDTSNQYTFERPNKRKSIGKEVEQSTKKKKYDYKNVEHNKKKLNNDGNDDTENNFISKYGSDKSLINSGFPNHLLIKQQIAGNQSKSNSFVTESNEDSVDCINTPSSVSHNIFNSTDMSSLDLDDILDL